MFLNDFVGYSGGADGGGDGELTVRNMVLNSSSNS